MPLLGYIFVRMRTERPLFILHPPPALNVVNKEDYNSRKLNILNRNLRYHHGKNCAGQNETNKDHIQGCIGKNGHSGV